MRLPPRVGAVCAAVLLVAGAGGSLTACSSSSQGSSGRNFVQADGNGSITYVAPAKRGSAVSMRGTTLEGQPFDLSALHGKIVVMNVWGSWCAPCRKEAPDLQKAWVALGAKGVQFMGINVRESDKAQALAFQRTFGITYPSLTDDGGQALLSLRGAVAANAIPTTVVIDTEGRIAARVSGTTTATTLNDLVTDVTAGKAGA
jgi:thiol-disulfide isomerase/thioredoxin